MKYPKVLVPTDVSAESLAVVRLACGLRAFGVESVVAMHVLDTHGLESPVAHAKRREVDEHMHSALEELKDVGCQLAQELCLGSAAECVLGRASKPDIELIVMGSTGKTPIEELLLGSVSEQVVREAHTPILFVRYTVVVGKSKEDIASIGDGIVEVVLHPTDFSDNSNRALDAALRLGPGRVVIAHAIEQKGLPPEAMAELDAQAREKLETVRRRVERFGLRVDTRVGLGDPTPVMVDLAAEEGATLVALGSTGRGLVRETILGSVSASILRDIEVPALVIH